MIVSILIDQWRIGDIGFTGWSYYMLADRCARHGWRLITEERYRDWVPEHPETSDAVGGQPAWSYTYTGHEREIAEGEDSYSALTNMQLSRYSCLTSGSSRICSRLILIFFWN